MPNLKLVNLVNHNANAMVHIYKHDSSCQDNLKFYIYKLRSN